MTQRRVLSLATPINGENLLQTLGGAVDNFMVARILLSGRKVVASSVSALRPLVRSSLLGRLVCQ
jgi:Na+-driven multidrug efflux pump